MAITKVIQENGDDLFDLTNYNHYKSVHPNSTAYTTKDSNITQSVPMVTVSGSIDTNFQTDEIIEEIAVEVNRTNDKQDVEVEVKKDNESENESDEYEDMSLYNDYHSKQINDLDGILLFNQKLLQKYILHCAQQLEGGGLRGN